MKSLTNDIFIRTSCLLDNRLEYCGGTAFHGNIFAPWHLTLTLCQMAAGVKPCLCYTTVRPLRRFTVKPEFTRKQNSGPSFSLRGRTPLIFQCVKQWALHESATTVNKRAGPSQQLREDTVYLHTCSEAQTRRANDFMNHISVQTSLAISAFVVWMHVPAKHSFEFHVTGT